MVGTNILLLDQAAQGWGYMVVPCWQLQMPPLFGVALGVFRTEFLGWQLCSASALSGDASTGSPHPGSNQSITSFSFPFCFSASKESTGLGLAVVGVRASCFFAAPLVLAASRALALVPHLLTGRL